MNKLVVLFAVLAGFTPGVRAASPAFLTTVRAVAALTNRQASLHSPVSFQATVTYFRGYDADLFVQDGTTAIYVHTPAGLKLVQGDRVLVRGTTHESFRPFVDGKEIILISHGPLPKPEQATVAQMARADTDCKFVTVRAFIRSANLVSESRSFVPAIYLRMLIDGQPADANIDSSDASALQGLLGAEVQITGVVSGHFDNKMQQTGILFHVQSLAWIKILHHQPFEPWLLPVTPMDRMFTGYRIRDLTQRMRVEGTITYYQPGAALVLQDGPKSLWIQTDAYNPLRIGDRATAIGFPAIENGFLTLTQSEIRDSSVSAPIVPSLFTWRDLASGGNESASHIFDLVSIEGQVVTEVRQATQDEYVLEANGRLFSAIFRHPGSLSRVPLLPMKQVALGSRIRVTGICMLADANPFNGEVPFNVLIRNFDDIAIITRPPLLNVRRLMLLVGLLLSVVIAIGARSWFLERRIRHKTAALAYVERRRSLILEAINSSQPLSETIEQITEVVSFKLHGAACWCEIGDDARLGKWPAKITSQRIIQHEIPSRSGVALGTIHAAIHRLSRPCPEESEALSLGASLAALAIETSRLYSDLVHRSEFDLLTDVPNRFSLEKQLHALIHDASQFAAIFGLIFIDLDRFKQVNDQYGHQVGDLYLQQTALRMKHQLRPADTLARLGGDEFAVVVPAVRKRAELEEIALRLEHSFDEPFSVGGIVVHGSASVGIALYPEDAGTADGLLSSADGAMYVVKQSRHCDEQRPVVAPSSSDLAHCA
jgi:diguanylate cyclase (GGDEF)-like protein